MLSSGVGGDRCPVVGVGVVVGAGVDGCGGGGYDGGGGGGAPMCTTDVTSPISLSSVLDKSDGIGAASAHWQPSSSTSIRSGSRPLHMPACFATTALMMCAGTWTYSVLYLNY